MTFEQCQAQLDAIRSRQGTSNPLVRIDYGGVAYRGRLARSDSDPERRRASGSPFGVVVLEVRGFRLNPQCVRGIGRLLCFRTNVIGKRENLRTRMENTSAVFAMRGLALVVENLLRRAVRSPAKSRSNPMPTRAPHVTRRRRSLGDRSLRHRSIPAAHPAPSP